MRSFLSLAVIAPLVPTVFGLTINTPPSVVQCQPALLTWSGSVGPYFLTVLPGGQPSALPLKTFDKTDATSLTWIVDIAAGTPISLQIKDNTGAVAFTDQVKIVDSSDSSCVNPSLTVASGPPGAGGAAASGAATPDSTTESMASGATTTETRATTGSSTTSSPDSNASNAAVRGAISYGAVGIAGLWGLVAAL